MLESLEYYARIDRFYQDELSPEEKVQFEIDLAADPQLKREFLLEKELDALLLKSEMIEFRKMMVGLRNKNKRQQCILRVSLWTGISLVLFSVACYLLLHGFCLSPVIHFFRYMH